MVRQVQEGDNRLKFLSEKGKERNDRLKEHSKIVYALGRYKTLANDPQLCYAESK